MPVYEYRCRDCGKEFEIIALLGELEDLKPKCTGCGSRKVERRWSSVFAVTSKKS